MIRVGYTCISLCLASKEYYEAAGETCCGELLGYLHFCDPSYPFTLTTLPGLQSVAI